jgi:hypothetical protein
MTKELQRSAKNRLGGLAHNFFTRKDISRPELYSNMASYLCSSLQELHGEDSISFCSILVLCGRKLFIGGAVASAAQLQLSTPTAQDSAL